MFLFLDRVGQTLVAGSDPLCPALQIAGELKPGNRSFQLRSEKICFFILTLYASISDKISLTTCDWLQL